MIEENKPNETKLNELLSDAFDKATSERETIADDESNKEVIEKRQEVTEKPEKKETKERGADGKFKAKAEKDPKEQPQEDTPDIEEKSEDEITDQSVEEKEVVAPVSKAPDSWSAGAKAHWEKLDPVVRAEALKQVEFANKMQARYTQERQKYDAIDKALEPQRNLLRANYGDEANGLKALFALSDFASKDPRGFIQYFAQQRGIDLRGLTQNQPQQANYPNLTALQQRIEQLTQHINGFEQTQKEAVYNEIDRTYQEFAANPANKYLDEVRDDMAFFIESGKAQDWQTAYNMAIKINPTVSELVEAEKLQAIQEKRRKEAEEAANKARKAKEMNVKSSGVVKSTEATGSWMDTLTKTADKLMGA